MPVTEEHPLQHKNFVYGWVKIAAESIFLSQCNVPWLGFRYYNVYSERSTNGALYSQIVPIFAKKILKNEELTVYGDGTQTMDMIHAKDIAEANVLGLFSNVTKEFFNVGTGIETSVNKLIEYFGEVYNIKTKIKYIKDDSQKVKHRKSSIKKITKMLNFKPKIKIIDGLQRFKMRYYYNEYGD